MPAEFSDYKTPTDQCDLVMKGGITSGIVYPAAVLELARKFRFRSIGGTSAGAIAAAVTAAAEYGRESGGFDRLATLNTWLSSDKNLFDLFQPSPATKPLMTALLDINDRNARARKARKESNAKRSSRLSRIPRSGQLPGRMRILFADIPGVLRKSSPWVYWICGICGTALGTVLGTLILRGLLPYLHPFDVRIVIPALLFLGLPLGWVAAALGVAVFLLRRLTRVLPTDFYGMCTGRKSAAGKAGAPALTDWLHDSINKLAGRDPAGPPLTLRELKEKGEAKGTDKESIVLRTMTTNLSQGQPYVLPFEKEVFLFREEEMTRLFPEPVVAYLKANPPESRQLSLKDLKGFHLLPLADDLPVVVAARLSLSFPMLLSAVPLYTVNREAFVTRPGKTQIDLREDDLQKNWFSDGGISSNFPIHFFDRWLPTRPTFGINLTTLPERDFEGGEQADPAKVPQARERVKAACQTMVLPKASTKPEPERQTLVSLETEGIDDPDLGRAVYLPQADKPQYPNWTEINGIIGFLLSAWTTAQNYRDNAQSRLPSYRERIVQVRFAPDEGGLNLAMGRDAIASITAKGREAAALLLNFNFDEHRWVRFRVLMSQLEAQLVTTRLSFPDCDAYKRLLKQGALGSRYPQDEEWCDEALRRMEAMLDLLGTWDKHHQQWRTDHAQWKHDSFFPLDWPEPEPALRVTPRL